MNNCNTYEPLIAELLFGALSPEEQQQLAVHLEACPGCRAMVQDMQTTLQRIAEPIRPEPAPVFWEGYHERLEARIARDARRREPVERLLEWLRVPGRLNGAALLFGPRWAYQLSAALVLLGMGVLIGWMVFGNASPEAPQIVEAPQGVETPVQAASMEARTTRYLERSKVLLLGLVNLEPEQDPSLLNLSHKRQVARELIDESNALRADLDDADQRLLRVLIEDLEVILLQIANLEAGHDLPAIEMVQRGVDQRAILLKINLTEMRREAGSVQPAVAPAARPDSSTL